MVGNHYWDVRSRRSPYFHRAPTIHNLRIVRDWVSLVWTGAAVCGWMVDGITALQAHNIFPFQIFGHLPQVFWTPAALLFLVYLVLACFIALTRVSRTEGWFDDAIPRELRNQPTHADSHFWEKDPVSDASEGVIHRLFPPEDC